MRMAIVIVLVAIGCTSESSDGDECGPVRGSYRASFVELDGDCGPQGDEIIAAANVNAGTYSAPCTGYREVYGCEIVLDAECETDALWISREATLTQDPETEIVSGVIDIEARDLETGETCSSAYRMTLTPL